MDIEKTIREQLLKLLRGGQAHIDFAQAIERFPLGSINTPLPGSDYTAWRLLEHIRIAQWDILEFIRNPGHVSPPWPAGYWPTKVEMADPNKWKQTISSFQEDLQAMQAIVEDAHTDLFTSLPHAEGYTILREVLVLADHNAYHMGEFGLLSQALETWPKE